MPCHYPHLRRGFLTETNVSLHRSHGCGHRSGSSKPRRGGLFIATDAPEIVLFVFRRRGTRTISVRRTCLDAGNLVGSLWECRAAEKQKGGVQFAFSPINRPPLRGL